MKVLNATVNWGYGWVNNPGLIMLVDKFPNWEQVTYRFRHEPRNPRLPPAGGPEEHYGLYWAEKEGAVRFQSWSGPSQGYGGSTFSYLMEDGSVRKLKGPWSSRPSYMNKHFPHSMDVTITDDPAVWERGYTFYGGHILVALGYEAIKKFCPYARLVQASSKGSGTGDMDSAQEMIVTHGLPARDHEVSYVIRPLSNEAKPPKPPETDPRWSKMKHPMWNNGIKGSELFAPYDPVEWSKKCTAISSSASAEE